MLKTATETEDDDVASAVTESTVSVSTQDKQVLQEKLQELQMKKQRMDQLLEELQALRIERDFHNSGQLNMLPFLPCCCSNIAAVPVILKFPKFQKCCEIDLKF